MNQISNRELRGGATQSDSSLNSPGSGRTKRNRKNIPYVLTGNLRYEVQKQDSVTKRINKSGTAVSQRLAVSLSHRMIKRRRAFFIKEKKAEDVYKWKRTNRL